jgi:hypothetical protein
MGIELKTIENYIYTMKLKSYLYKQNESSANRTNDLSCLLFVLFLLISQLLYVRTVDKKIIPNTVKHQHQQSEVLDY